MKKFLCTAAAMTIMTTIASAADITVESQQQHFKDEENKIELKGDVKVKYDDINVASPKAEVLIDPDSGKVKTVRFEENAYSYQISEDKKHEIKAKILEVSLLNKVFKAEERTQSTVLKNQQPTVIVTADLQEYDNKNNIIKAKGGVIIYYQDTEAFADYAQVDLNKTTNGIKKLRMTGHGKITKKDSTVTADEFVYYADKKITTAKGNVFTDVNDEKTAVKVWSDYQQIDRNSNIIIASGKTLIKYQDYVATGPKATVFPDKKTNKFNEIVFTGRSKITQQKRSIEADKIVLTMNPKDFYAEGNVKTFIPNVQQSDNDTPKL